jgi:hypothetical protein
MKFRTLLIILLLLVCPIMVFSQGGDGTPPPPESQGPPQLPVDGGIIALVIAGLFYGVKKSFKKK